MKRTVKMALIAAVLMLTSATTFAQESVKVDYGNNPYGSNQSNVTLINNTDMAVFVSFVYYDAIDETWVSRGWRDVPAHGTNHINFGNYVGNVYIHGMQQGNTNWGSGYWFCCKEGLFRIIGANGNNCDKKEYSKIFINGGNVDYPFNP